MRRAKLGVAAVIAATLLSGCYTTGTATTRHPNGSTTEVTFKKGVFDDVEIPAPDPVTGAAPATLRVGTSKVAGEVAFRMFQFSGDSLRQYALDRASQAVPTKY